MVLCIAPILSLGSLAVLGQSAETNSPWPDDPYRINNRPPDEHYKVDVLVVVAHPDDEIMAAAYIARLVDQGKRVALVWTTRGDGGINEEGPEQSSAMGDIREVEALRAAEFLAVTIMWDLGGPDTPTQDPLESLETCNHGRCLDRLVRIVRLTRPAVILTWLPLAVSGENHGDHQAAGILATEAFDLAGDPTAYSEQVTPAREPKQNLNRLEGLRPWQPQKIYYFSNPTHTDFFARLGPQYSTADVSPSRHLTYGQIAAEEFTLHGTQGGDKFERSLREKGLDALGSGPVPLDKPSQFILGKSLVPCGVADDVFAGIVPEGIPFHRAPGFTKVEATAPVIALGGSWNFYNEWWPAHGVEHLASLIPPEVTIQIGGSLTIPLIIDNPLDRGIHVIFHVDSPNGWKVTSMAPADVGAHSLYFVRAQAVAPSGMLQGWQQFQVTAEAEDKSLGIVPLRVELHDWALPQ